MRGLLEGVRQRSSKSPRPQDNRWVTHLEEDELASLRHRLVTSIRRNLHICLVSHSSQVLDTHKHKLLHVHIYATCLRKIYTSSKGMTSKYTVVYELTIPRFFVCVCQVSENWWRRYPCLRGRWVWVRMAAWAGETLMEVARRALLPVELPPPVLHQLQASLPAIHQVCIVNILPQSNFVIWRVSSNPNKASWRLEQSLVHEKVVGK